MRMQKEINDTSDLLKKSQDHKVACKIRRFIADTERMEEGTLNPEWIARAKKKADWIDPLTDTDDPFFGKRMPRKPTEQTNPEKYLKQNKASIYDLFDELPDVDW